MIVIVQLPEGYRYNNFTLTVIEKSDRAQIAQITEDVRKQNDDLQTAVETNTPKPA